MIKPAVRDVNVIFSLRHFYLPCIGYVHSALCGEGGHGRSAQVRDRDRPPESSGALTLSTGMRKVRKRSYTFAEPLRPKRTKSPATSESDAGVLREAAGS